jgi:ADP-ribose pyrophosphatase YjhB (NUDIX family)
MIEKEQQAVVAYIRREDGKLLSVTRKDTGQHSAPGGKVESGEVRLGALLREVHEETGLCLNYFRVGAPFYSGIHTSGRRVFAYLIAEDVWSGEPTAREPGTRVEWVEPIEIANGFGAEYHTKALRRAGLI